MRHLNEIIAANERADPKRITHRPTGDELRVLRREVRLQLTNALHSAVAAARPISVRTCYDDSPLRPALAKAIMALNEVMDTLDEVLP